MTGRSGRRRWDGLSVSYLVRTGEYDPEASTAGWLLDRGVLRRDCVRGYLEHCEPEPDDRAAALR